MDQDASAVAKPDKSSVRGVKVIMRVPDIQDALRYYFADRQYFMTYAQNSINCERLRR